MSLNASMCLKDATGKLLTGSLNVEAPDGFNGGTPLVADRRIAVTAATTGLFRVAGLAYDNAGRLAVAAAGPVVTWVAGVPVDASGRVVSESAAAVFYAPNGIPITATGAVAMAASVVGDPADLFSSGEEGVWFDPSDLGTMFQDTSGLVPVTDAGQPVRKILDKSGNDNHATASNATLQRNADGLFYLSVPASDELQTANIDFTVTDKMTVWAGLHKDTAALTQGD